MKEAVWGLSRIGDRGLGDRDQIFCVCIVVVVVIFRGVEVDKFDGEGWGGARVG